MNWPALAAKLAAKGLPAIAAAVAGPAPALAASAIASRIGAAEATPEVLEQAVDAADPADIVALRELDAEMELERMAHAERMADRHAADVERVRAVFQGSIMPAVVFGVLSGMVTVFVSAVMVLPYFLGGNMSGEQWDFVKFFGPMLFTAWTASVVYFVGSSAGSASKERMMAQDRRP